ncbi:MAG TPA: 3-methyl-2-oxobutanoate hydroxymethyltransferase [Candidatus Limnocylindrales bacterium]|nr:3-methyl-2-oxobutanoate hydroxymethyltransferase [Candidatus Limnocylindrales bacterium]
MTRPTDRPRRITVAEIARIHAAGERMAMLTAYDYPTAQLLDEAGIPLILVGDSVGRVILGYENEIPVTLEDMLHHTRAVARGVRRALVIADMPFLTYADPERALVNAGRLVAEGGAGAVKVEGGRRTTPVIERLSGAGIAVMGHVGLTPQSIGTIGTFRVQGRTADAARALIDDAEAVAAAGAFAVVLELVPDELAAEITGRLAIPTIGIGAGPHCSGQVQVVTDLLGLGDWLPRHARRYADLRTTIADAARAFAADVASGDFPGEEQTARMDSAVLDEALRG